MVPNKRNEDLGVYLDLSLLPRQSNENAEVQEIKQRSEAQMLAAISSIQDEGLSGNKAADLHGILHSILKDRLSGRIIHGTKSGLKSYLTAEEESNLEMHLLQVSRMGFGEARLAVKIIVQKYVYKRMAGYGVPPKVMDGGPNY